MASPAKIPDATVSRLPLYLRGLAAGGLGPGQTLSSDDLAELAGVNAAKVRKDLSYLGTYGTRGVGYDAEFLRLEIGRALGAANRWPVLVVGMGNLGRALANHTGFTDRGFPVVAAVDSDPDKIGRVIDGVPVSGPDEIDTLVTQHGIGVAVVSTPGDVAQDATDALVAAGVKSILSFAPTVLVVPDDVELRSVDLAAELQILGFHLHRSAIEHTTSEKAG